MQPDDDVRRHQWERRSAWPLMLGSLVFLAVYATPIVQPDLSSDARRFAGWMVAATWLLFAVDYLVRLGLTAGRRAFIRRHPLDLAVVDCRCCDPSGYCAC